MAQYLAPGVYIEEVPGAKPFQAVGTATGAFVGVAEKGPIGSAQLITNWTQFVETFGGFVPSGYLAYAVNQFFTEGGTKCWVVRTCSYDYTTVPAVHRASTGSVTLRDTAATPAATLRVDALTPGSWSDHLWVEIADAKKGESKFRVVVWFRGRAVEAFEELTRDNVVGAINGVSQYIKVLPSTSTLQPRRSEAVLKDGLTPAQEVLRVTALAPGLSLGVAPGTEAGKFDLTVLQGTTILETFAGVNTTDVEAKVNGISAYVKVVATTNPDRPAATGTTPVVLPFFGLIGGDDGLADGVVLNDAPVAPVTATPALIVSAFRSGVSVQVAANGAFAFDLAVSVDGVQREEFKGLLPDTVENLVNGASQFVEVRRPPALNPNRPAAATADVPTGLADMDFIGDEATKNGLHAFDVVDDLNIVAIPDRPGDREVIIMAYAYCQQRKDCFFVADAPFGLKPADVVAFKQATGIFSGNAFNSSYAALYYPWVLTADPLTGGSKFVPPSGAVVGTYSATDVNRGVHKAPAGTLDGYLDSVVGVEYLVTKGEQELLNPENINVIRSFPGAGIVIWGARTLSADPEWRYVNIRRLLLFIEETVDKNTQWVVFEPNDQLLWARVKRDVSAFLTEVWRSGALFGATPEQAFFVKIDTENNPPESRDAGRLVVDIGVAPVKPAEFVIFRVTQQTPKK